ncbi:MAG: cation:proton antiporter, partial [Polyangiales bacterium]
FSLAATAAGRLLGLAGGGSLWNEIGIHIGGSIAAGLALGALISLYLRYVRREVLLFLVAFVYTATYVAQRLHLDPVLLFLAAGFLVANFSREGETLIHSVEKLSLPVYVVFFTLAGASLHLDQFLQLAPFALALVLMRVLAMFLGCRLGAGLVRADESTRRYAWLGFVSQAGVALSLAQLVGQRFGGVGQALQTLIIAAIAVNELFGPILLKVALQLAGEIPKPQAADAPTPSSTSQPAASDAPTALSTWQQDARTADAWGAPVESVSAELREVLVELESDLQHIVRDFDAGALSALRQQGEAYLRELRREFLRHHRRVFAQLRSPEAGAQPKTWLRKEQAELTERWRGIVLARGTKLSQQDWTLDGLVQRIDQRVMNVPERLRAPFEPESYLPRQDGSWWAGLARARLRARRRLRRLWGMGEPMRAVDVRVLARFHLSGRVPAELEGLASLLVQADNHLAARTRSIFSGIVRRYDALIARRTRPPEVAPQQEEAPAELEAQLLQLRQDTEAELQLALCEVQSIATDAQWRATLPLSQAMQRIKHDALVLGTHALPRRKRRVSRLFRRRGAALHTLTHDLKAV